MDRIDRISCRILCILPIHVTVGSVSLSGGGARETENRTDRSDRTDQSEGSDGSDWSDWSDGSDEWRGRGSLALVL